MYWVNMKNVYSKRLRTACKQLRGRQQVVTILVEFSVAVFSVKPISYANGFTAPPT
jgi:hypothetical protein